jgi:hypothetical protein
LEKIESFRNILKEVLSTDRGTKFYVITKIKDDEPDANKDESNIMAMDELLPNTKLDLETQNFPYLTESIISLDLFKRIKDL